MTEETGIQNKLKNLSATFKGEIRVDLATRLMYATDASAYREVPLGVVYPKNSEDVRQLINFANEHNAPIIPRTAGTSLAGQVVGKGIVADVSKHMNRILELNEDEHWVRVEPGVILDELNAYLRPHGLFFGPETSTSNRCMIGGMVGNNACGAHSLVYGSTRDHTLELETILSDGSDAVFKSVTKKEFNEISKGDTLENAVYRQIKRILSDEENKKLISSEYPDPAIKRRNTGYALDVLMNSSFFGADTDILNLTKLLAGSEGTLAFTTAIKLNLVQLPPDQKVLVCVHHETVPEALRANLIALKHKPVAVELIDKVLLDLTKRNIEQARNREFVEGDPGAVLVVEFAEDNPSLLRQKANAMVKEMQEKGFGYSYPQLYGNDIQKVWNLRKAGLGILTNMPGDAKPVPVVEDTAVDPPVLPDYIAEIEKLFSKYGKQCVYYAHISTGELHLRPVLNLKDPYDVKLFHTLARETALLVKKYKGSLSGEHGDGRLRGEFIPLVYGEKIYELFEEVKKTWDPKGIFNPAKIVNTPPMNSSLRYEPGKETKNIKTVFDFSDDRGILRATEKCNGAAACRKGPLSGGAMCPSYMASGDEDKTTRARANILREFLTNSAKENPFDHEEIYRIMDLCLSCKACKSECPSSVDITKLKAEFLQHYYDSNGISNRTRLIANISRLNRIASLVPWKYNFFVKNDFFSRVFARLFGFAPQRKFPELNKQTLYKWWQRNGNESNKTYANGKVYLFCDEFTNYNDAETGQKAILLLNRLGYEVIIPGHSESGRAFLSKGMVRKARSIAMKNINLLSGLVSEATPLVGIEPSAILTFRDEYPELAGDELKEKAQSLAANCLLIDEFLEKEMKAGRIPKESFSAEEKVIKFHGHCHQKALATTASSLFILNFPENYSAEEIPSGCCGMAGSFGYEKEHYDLSMKVGELVLFPAVRKTNSGTLVAAPGTSCRHQIKDGTGRKAYHPVEILYKALK